jgi:20S proteasome alpha/beta subunit
VTIAIGFRAEEAIVLAADRQVTSSAGLKYQEKKVFSFFGHGWSVSLTYAGYCDIFRSIHDKLRAELHSPPIVVPSFPSVCQLTERILAMMRKDHGVKMLPSLLLAISIGPEIRLYKAELAVVSPAGSWKCLGYGESPLTHYLVDLLMSSSRDRFDQFEAMLLAIYVVSQANQYIEGCDGGPDLLVVRSQGVVELLRKSPPLRVLRLLASLSHEVAEMWGGICELAKSDQEFMADMEKLTKRLAKIKRQLRSIPPNTWANDQIMRRNS